MLKPVIAAACLCATLGQAQSSDLSGQQINDLLAGATVEIDTPLGSKLPIRYGRDGKLSGRRAALPGTWGGATDGAAGGWPVTSCATNGIAGSIRAAMPAVAQGGAPHPVAHAGWQHRDRHVSVPPASS